MIGLAITDLGGTALPDIVTTSIYAFVIAFVDCCALLLISRDEVPSQFFGGCIAALAGFLALTAGGSLLWRLPFALHAFGVMSAGYFRGAMLMQAERKDPFDVLQI